jgi:uncharacterized Fe-S cluster-containing radical SAM superfamily protein
MMQNNQNQLSASLRNKAIDIESQSILITAFKGSKQEKDLSVPANCNGYGRVRHFNLDAGEGWPLNPIPILPASKKLGVPFDNNIRAQVFQSSVCNWRCWYCFVDNKLLNGNHKYASFLNCDELVDLYSQESDPAPVIDLTGGQPDLTPEWVPWMMQALIKKGLSDKVFLWSDDNLSTDYLWKYLNVSQIELLASYKMYSRVCCFKGIDERAFSMNTGAETNLFSKQFELCQRLLGINLDLYCYITLTASTDTNFTYSIPKFFDRIQKIDELLPLRMVPLRIFKYTPVISRMKENMFEGQLIAIKHWKMELSKRFSQEQLQLPITDIELKKY